MAIEYLDPNKQFFVGQDTPQTGVPAPTPPVSTANKPVSTAPVAPVLQSRATMPSTKDVAVVPQVKLPTPTAPNIMANHIATASSDIEAQRKAVEDAYKLQIENINKKQAEAQKAIDTATKQQEGAINSMQDITTPFRNQLENVDRDRLSINENYQANQSLIRELDTLLTQSNNMMTQLRGSKIPGLAGISQSPRALQAIADVSARVGVIQAVMSARSNQIAEGERMIDRSVTAINADRNDQLNYYKTVYDFAQTQKDDAGNKLLNLNNDEKGYINKQINLLESDMQRSIDTAEYIKKLMISPDTAKFMADSGVTLNDSIETIKAKMGKQADIVERQTQAKANIEEAMTAGITTQFYSKNGAVIRTSDGWAFKDKEEFQAMTGMSIDDAISKGLVTNYSGNDLINRNQVVALMGKYFDAGIKPTDSLEVAVQKAETSSKIYKDQVRGPVGSGGNSGTGDTEIDQYAQAVYSGSLKLTGVPQKIRGQVDAAVKALQANASSKYDNEFDARVDYNLRLKDITKDITDGAVDYSPSQAISILSNDFGGKISPQEIQGTVYGLFGVERPQAQTQSTPTNSPRYDSSFGGSIKRNLGDFWNTLRGKGQ